MAPPLRPMPADFKERAAALPRIDDLVIHYRAGDTTVHRWLKEAGIRRPVRVGRYKMPADFTKVGPTMHVEGLTRHYGVLRKVIKRWLAEADIEAAPAPNGEYSAKCRPIPHDFDQVAPTMAISALADHYRTGLRTVQRWVSQAGVIPKPYERPVKQPSKQFNPRRPSRGTVHAIGLPSHIQQERIHTVHDVAVRTLARYAPTYRCNERGKVDVTGTHFRHGNVVLTPDELLAKAERYREKVA